FDAPAVVEESAIDEPEGAGDRRRGAVPRRRAGRRLRSTPQAGAEPSALGGGRGGEEDDVARLRGLHRTRGAAVDPGGQHPREERPVEPRVVRYPRAVARAPVEGETCAHDGVSLSRELALATPGDDHVRKRRDTDLRRR